ncbi:MAG: Txe/YoeB family addiction module toxin [bacterium]
MIITFTKLAAKDLFYWKKKDNRIFLRIKFLLREIEQSPLTGIGKPEKLVGNLAGYYSRRITHEHRLIYSNRTDQITVISCRFHY